MGIILLLTRAALAGETKEAELAPGRRIYIVNADGSAPRRLTDEFPEYDRQGSPDWSQDGRLIAFDAWQVQNGQDVSDADILMVNVETKEARVLIDGVIPSFSPGGHRMAVSRFGPHRGVWVVNTEGPQEGVALIDESGWGANWSPDGRMIAYTKPTAQGANLVILNVIEGTRRLVFDEKNSPYSQIYWNFGWSPDSTHIVFCAVRNGKKEISIVEVRGAKYGLVTRLQENVRASFSWRGDGERILFDLRRPKGEPHQLYLLDPDSKASPQRLPGQNPKWRHINPCYSPDGGRIAVAIQPPK